MKIYLLTITAFSFLSIGCSKSELITSHSTYRIGNVPNATYDSMGWLKFQNGDALRATLAILEVADSSYEADNHTIFEIITSGMEPYQVDSIYQHYGYLEGAPIEQFENTYPDFTSLRHKLDNDEANWLFNAGSTLNLESEPDHPLNVPYINSLLNENGEIQVGDYVHFFKNDGHTLAIKRDYLNVDNINNVRNAINAIDYNNLIIQDTLVNPDSLSVILYGGGNITPDPSAQSFTVVITIAGSSYILANVYNAIQGIGLSNECKFCHTIRDSISSSNHIYSLKSKFCGTFLIGQFSSASIKHYEYSNNKWKKAKANMGIYNFTPMRFNTIGCDGDIDDVSEIGSPNSPFTRVWKNVSKTKNVGVYHSRSIKSNERFTKFYIDGNLVKQLNNIW
jgi:hypothetical protein